MNWIDYVVLGVIGLSMLFGLFRGLVREVVAIIGWIAAFLLAVMFSSRVAVMMPVSLGDPGRYVAAFLAILLGVWLLAAIAGWLLSRLVKAVGLSIPDRLLGAIFGAARGLVVVLAAVVVAGLMPLPRSPEWQAAVLTGPLETMVIAAKPYLPEGLAKRLKYK